MKTYNFRTNATKKSGRNEIRGLNLLPSFYKNNKFQTGKEAAIKMVSYIENTTFTEKNWSDLKANELSLIGLGKGSGMDFIVSYDPITGEKIKSLIL